MDFAGLLLFISIALVATVTPGPAILLATTHSLQYGMRASVFTILGNVSGLLLMSALSVAGLSAVILGSELLFNLIKFAGALYLMYLGFKLWRHGFVKLVATAARDTQQVSRRKLYFSGLAVALSNPKAIAFTTALFPQFIDPAESVLLQFGILVVIFMGLSFVCLFAYATLMHTSKRRFLQSSHGYLSQFMGAAFMVSGLALAWASPSK